jgi:hypothetical protein
MYIRVHGPPGKHLLLSAHPETQTTVSNAARKAPLAQLTRCMSCSAEVAHRAVPRQGKLILTLCRETLLAATRPQAAPMLTFVAALQRSRASSRTRRAPARRSLACCRPRSRSEPITSCAISACGYTAHGRARCTGTPRTATSRARAEMTRRGDARVRNGEWRIEVDGGGNLPNTQKGGGLGPTCFDPDPTLIRPPPITNLFRP